jgi:hypothetical protein
LKANESKIVSLIIILGVIITGSMVAYSFFNPPEREEYVAISVLNSEFEGVGLISVQNVTDFNFYFLIENRLGYTGYFELEILRGEITNDTNPSFSESTTFRNQTILLKNNQENLINITDNLNFTDSDLKFIYYCRLYIYNLTLHQLEYSEQWVAMQVELLT